MDKQIIMLNSITYAYKARDFLYTKNITAYIERVPAHLRNNGCGYGIRINNKDFDRAVKLLQDEGYRIKDIIKY